MWKKMLFASRTRRVEDENGFEVEAELMMPMPHAIMSFESFAFPRSVSFSTKWNAKFPPKRRSATCNDKTLSN